ncbi:MAG: hypothetical protein R8K54_07800 [Mariprofundaceae bacterium]
MNRYVTSILIVGMLPFTAMAEDADVILLTQTACQIIEAEVVERQFSAHSPDQCRDINERTGESRVRQAKVLHLKAGDYTFRVQNRDVPYELGFWLRGAGLSRLTLPSVSGGGLLTGNSKDYKLALQAGEYLYSCPLNPTPDYILIVE